MNGTAEANNTTEAADPAPHGDGSVSLAEQHVFALMIVTIQRTRQGPQFCITVFRPPTILLP